ncbi:restriction endonuclease subunit S [Vibrio harveyi]|uniref:restriction endonuclease subunit S n=1 Tax=Vibrio harveyi TaxID=669 RepID=UPI00238000A4|nr:restriction endonuclease subunit S [Vibrio harveyi]EGQ9823630.1 restriction endonuclease subunit S [Vibrio parahaemolyticus]
MKKVKLSEVCDISSGGTPSRKNAEFFKGEIPWAKISDIENAYNGVIYDTEEHISTEGLKNIRGKLFPTGSLLFAMYGSIGKVAICGRELSTNQAILGIRPKREKEIDLGFLKTWFTSNKQKLINQGRGAALKNLSATIVRDIEIELPLYDEQIRIAYLLGKVEGLIAQRKQHLQQLDDLLKSVFLEMFGDPVRNEKGWDKKPFSKLLADIESGKSPKCEARPAIGDEWGVLKLGAVTRCVFDGNENKALPSETAPTVKHEVKAGDLLFSRKNTYELVAACAYVYETRPRLLMPDLIFRFVFKEDAEINPIYIWKLLTNNSQRKAIQAFAAGAAGSMPNISKANLKTAQLPVPPIELQNQFAAIVEKVEALKSCYQKSLTDLESLYGALSQQAFKGELDLSQVQLPEPEQLVDEVAISIPEPEAIDQTVAIHLPESGLLPDALTDKEKRKDLFTFWLEDYCKQISNTPFSAKDFFSIAHTHITKLHPDAEFEFSLDDYDQIKSWVFEGLEQGHIKQTQNITGYEKDGKPILGNFIEIKAGITS